MGCWEVKGVSVAYGEDEEGKLSPRYWMLKLGSMTSWRWWHFAHFPSRKGLHKIYTS